MENKAPFQSSGSTYDTPLSEYAGPHSPPRPQEVLQWFEGSDRILLPLTRLDTMMRNFVVPILFIFPPPSTSTPFDLHKLHSSFLSLVEEDYPFLTGRFFTDPETGFVNIMQKTGPHQNRPTDIGFEINPQYVMTTVKAIQMRSWDLMPTARGNSELIRVKGSLLKDGGLCIGIDISHMLFDAEAIFTFMTVWGQHYSGVKKEQRLKLNHDRHLLNGSGESSTMQHPELRVGVNPKPHFPSKIPPVDANHRFHFSPSMMDKIKKVATLGGFKREEAMNASYVSTLDAITALFIVLISRARGHDDDVKCSTFVNARRRLEPPMPPNYTGNAVFKALSNFTNSELQPQTKDNAKVSPETLGMVARRVRGSILQCNDAYLRDGLNFLAEQKDDAVAQIGTHVPFGPDIMFTSWLHIGMYNAEFDGVHPWLASCPQVPGCDGVVLITEAEEGGDGIDVTVALECSALEKLIALFDEMSAELAQ
ncbi:hypothetical protein CCR75_005200 [Bremia lactucae]|uniref:Transferase n=1 Tax=Bremia lactucae TaxID=4779 RepID=A0A976IM68_BRELC|nr:hypothetical protein CCR75_005200 [Bremia lactucae]